MATIKPTRSELIKLKKKVKLAKKGHSLLKKKQDYLINEFFKLVKEYREYRQSMQEDVNSAYTALSLDIAYNGATVTRSVSYATKEGFELWFENKNMMGVAIPQLNATEKEVTENTFENSPLLADATKKFRLLFGKLVKLSSMKLMVYTLAEEIKTIKRRVNSLEHIQIPRLEKLSNYIIFVLGEQEREAFSRLKMIKAKL